MSIIAIKPRSPSEDIVPISKTRYIIQQFDTHDQLPRSPERLNHLKNALYHDAEDLFNRRQKSREKKRRVQLMYEELYNRRSHLISKIYSKDKKLEQQLSQNDKIWKEKFKGRSEKFNRVVNHHIEQNRKMLSTNLYKRRELYDEQNAYSQHGSQELTSKMLTGKTTPKAQKDHLDADMLQMHISDKLRRAAENQSQQRRRLLDRVRYHDRKVYEIRDKHREQSPNEQIEKMARYFSKIEQARMKVRKYHITSERNKQIEYKMKRLKSNLSHIEDERQERIKELNDKFYRTYGFQRRYRNRTVDYKYRQYKNLHRLELYKYAWHNRILRKHYDLSLQNKAYKEGRDKLFNMMLTYLYV